MGKSGVRLRIAEREPQWSRGKYSLWTAVYKASRLFCMMCGRQPVYVHDEFHVCSLCGAEWEIQSYCTREGGVRLGVDMRPALAEAIRRATAGEDVVLRIVRRDGRNAIERAMPSEQIPQQEAGYGSYVESAS